MSLRYLLMFAVPILAVCPATLPAQQSCSVFTVAGTWAIQGQGTLFPIPPGASAPIAVPGGDIGIAYIGYDGSITINVTGNSTRAGVSTQTLTGTIDVRPDCTALVTAPTPIPGFTSKEVIMILDHGNEMWTLALNGLNAKPAVWQCHWTKLSPSPWPASPSNCSAGLIHGTYAGQYNGVLTPADASTPVPLGAVTMGGVTYQGQMEGTVNTSLGGNVSAGTYSGSIKEVRPDCTGTWTYTLKGADGAPLPGGGLEKFVILDNGKEIRTLSVQAGAGTPVGVGRWLQLSPAPNR